MRRYELPPDLTPEEQRVAIAALEHVLALQRPRLSPWVLAGRGEGLRLGALHLRHQTEGPWHLRADLPFAAGGTRPQAGRGDSR